MVRSKKLLRELAGVPRELHDLYRAVREMNTLVCEICHDEELNEHPSLGSNWTADWYLAMAKLAQEKGWQTMPPRAGRQQWFFEEFQVVGPRCAANVA